ncbi:hypothetical protein CONPUDRAFT_79784 [Coniophora puteana RWD-64-598 SS2]|uniref:Uncharacterized protein n=1 Tax=Coniophora puteana (strain RWD-64-598) TaxID=741705 RepID=A0A5M3N130_CONPW|nr:uncharacterized protein CONPUDRAFT_79784 [Coniophora puteana RWD-64-598 SS2]EIW85102.1 hypothetical protein CONPUDRAFT_79784 [Coniophora puteana RWD-64-598 SS2]
MDNQALPVPMDMTSHHSSQDGVSSGFPSLIPDESLAQNAMGHPSHESMSMYSIQVDPSQSITPSMQISMQDTSSNPQSLTAMDVMQPTASTRAPPPGYLTDFPVHPPPSFGVLGTLDSHLTLASPPTTDSVAVSANPSPAVQGMASSFSMSGVAPSSAGIPHTMPHLESSASSGTMASSGSELGFSPLSSGPPTSGQDPGFVFPPPDLGDSRVNREQGSPEGPADSHLMVVGSILKNIASQAQSASNACSLGQGVEAGNRIEDIKKTITLVSDLISAIRVSDAPQASRHPSPRSLSANNSVSPPSLTGNVGSINELQYPVPQYSPSPSDHTSTDGQAGLEAPDGSRKRCASSMAGDRANKSLKREPQDDHIGRFPTPPTVRSSWSDGPATFPQRHQHSLSGGSLPQAANFHPLSNASLPQLPFNTGTSVSSENQPRLSMGGINPPLGRVARSGSLNTGSTFSFNMSVPEVPSAPMSAPVTADYMSAQPAHAPYPLSYSPVSSPDSEGDNDSEAGDHSHSLSPDPSDANYRGASGNSQTSSRQGNSLVGRQSMENLSGSTAAHSNDVPQEYRQEVDRIFFEFLIKTCSNLDATDAKGEPIHQTLMAKKMQRLDESPDFRPFKFRIQAFTNAFLEELARQGYPEEKIPMKKIRNYLWCQPYISRFNEDGKKTKSKGNHIWNIDAKKATDGGWTFRPFHRRVAGQPPGVAYVGLRWSWTPRIWDPQASRSNLVVQYSSPSLPPWLSWEDDTLSGTPPPDAESCDITVEARFEQDGQEELLSETFRLNIAPVSTLDSAPSGSRRGSMNGDIHRPRRVVSDSTVPLAHSTSSRSLRGQNGSGLSSASHEAQVVQVLTTAAQRVAQEAQSQVIASVPNEPGPGFQSLAKQQHVLTVTAQVMGQEYSSSEGPSQPSVLVAAAQNLVVQAARQVAVDHAVNPATSGLPPSSVTVNEVSVATQNAVAQAVDMIGPLSSEVEIVITASKLLQQGSPVSMMDTTRPLMSMDALRSHSTGAIPTLSGGMPGAPPVLFPPAVVPAGVQDFGRFS